MNKKTLYLECYSGISGDMTVGALLDLGADEAVLLEALRSLPLDGFEIAISRVKKSGLDACDFNVILDPAHETHDHDMEYLHGHEHEHHHDHEHHHHHIHRGLPEIREILHASGLSERAKDVALRIFEVLAEAESKAHGVPADQVHFHEVGAVDSIVDIAAVAVCLDNLGIEDVIVSELYEGRGTIRCQHGILPVPVPAVTNIAASHGLILHMSEIKGELVTPTGAAIVAAIRTGDALPARYRIAKIGLGAGKRAYACAGVLRAMLIEGMEDPESGSGTEDTIWKLETNIDDCSGEMLGFTMEELLKAGARDVYYTPIYMKKNRPAYVLQVICGEDQVRLLEEVIFRNTTTIGIRRARMVRTVLDRRVETIATPLGEAQVKICGLDGKERRYPEYESVAKISREQGLPFQEVWEAVKRAAEEA